MTNQVTVEIEWPEGQTDIDSLQEALEKYISVWMKVTKIIYPDMEWKINIKGRDRVPSLIEYPRQCKHGLTQNELPIFIKDMDRFNHWMHGQTIMLCTGQQYNPETKKYQSDCGTPHGAIVYIRDVERYLLDKEPLD